MSETKTPPAAAPEPFRVAVVGSPCSGSEWLAHLLASSRDLAPVSAETPGDVAWKELPTRCVVNVPCYPTPAVLGALAQNDVFKVSVERHPLDVLVTVLHHSLFHRTTDRWLDGEGGNERTILGVTPRSEQFREYVGGGRAAAILGASRAWVAVSDCVRVCYEDLVADAEGQVTRLLSGWSKASKRTAAGKTNQPLPSLGWPALPGVWRSVLPASAVAGMSHVADGYPCEADSGLTDRQADENWQRIVAGDLTAWQEQDEANRKALAAARQQLEQVRGELTVMRMKFELSQRALGDAKPHPLSPLVSTTEQQRALVRRLEEVERELGHARAQLRKGVGKVAAGTPVGANSLALAVKIHGLAQRFPRVARIVKRLVNRKAA